MSDKLDEARYRINELDGQMRRLFVERMAAVRQVLEYKKEHGKAIFDPSREKAVLAKNGDALESSELLPYYTDFLQSVMDASKRYQRDLLGTTEVAYQGVAGAFSHIALTKLFPKATPKPYATFGGVFDAVAKGDTQLGVIPFENSYTGEVFEVLDLLRHKNCYVSDVFDLKIDQNLLALPGAECDNIKKIYSHHQALEQCADFLKEGDFEAISYPNTALAAKYVAESNDLSIAAVASKETAELYGLSVIRENINIRNDNTTRFIIICKNPPASGNRFSLMFDVPHKAGALAEVMQVFAGLSINMESIKSRPVRETPWKYYFYVEAAGEIGSENAQQLLKRLGGITENLKIIGAYTV